MTNVYDFYTSICESIVTIICLPVVFYFINLICVNMCKLVISTKDIRMLEAENVKLSKQIRLFELKNKK